MASEVSSLVAAAMSGGGLSYAASVAVAWFRSRSERQDKSNETDLKIEQHRDQLVIDLLTSARAESAQLRLDVQHARAESDTLRLLQNRAAHFDQALEHLEILLRSRAGGKPEEIHAAEVMAQAFVNRMKRIADARGTIANEVQREVSAQAIREATEPMMPPTPPATY